MSFFDFVDESGNPITRVLVKDFANNSELQSIFPVLSKLLAVYNSEDNGAGEYYVSLCSELEEFFDNLLKNGEKPDWLAKKVFKGDYIQELTKYIPLERLIFSIAHLYIGEVNGFGLESLFNNFVYVSSDTVYGVGLGLKDSTKGLVEGYWGVLGESDMLLKNFLELSNLKLEEYLNSNNGHNEYEDLGNTSFTAFYKILVNRLIRYYSLEHHFNGRFLSLKGFNTPNPLENLKNVIILASFCSEHNDTNMTLGEYLTTEQSKFFEILKDLNIINWNNRSFDHHNHYKYYDQIIIRAIKKFDLNFNNLLDNNTNVLLEQDKDFWEIVLCLPKHIVLSKDFIKMYEDFRVVNDYSPVSLNCLYTGLNQARGRVYGDITSLIMWYANDSGEHVPGYPYSHHKHLGQLRYFAYNLKDHHDKHTSEIASYTEMSLEHSLQLWNRHKILEKFYDSINTVKKEFSMTELVIFYYLFDYKKIDKLFFTQVNVPQILKKLLRYYEEDRELFINKMKSLTRLYLDKTIVLNNLSYSEKIPCLNLNLFLNDVSEDFFVLPTRIISYLYSVKNSKSKIECYNKYMPEIISNCFGDSSKIEKVSY